MSALQVPYEEMVEKLWKHETLPDMYHHCAVGIVGEVIELAQAEYAPESPAHVLEELGDLVFFTTRGLLWLNQHLEDFAGVPKDQGMHILFDAGELLDVTKRYKVYDKPLETERFEKHLKAVALCLHSKLRIHGYTLLQAQVANQQKLLTGEKARYKLGLFSTEQAQARADKEPAPDLAAVRDARVAD